jgi:hypothetical protein
MKYLLNFHFNRLPPDIQAQSAGSRLAGADAEDFFLLLCL